MRTHLTEKFIAALQPAPRKGQRIYYWDSEQPGLAVMVTSTGHKSFKMVRRIRGGGPVKYAYRPAWPDTTLEMAREKAPSLRVMLANGVDPNDAERLDRAERKRLKEDRLVTPLAEQFIKQKVYGKRAKTNEALNAQRYREGWVRHIIKVWGTKYLSEVGKDDYIALPRDLIESGMSADKAYKHGKTAREFLRWANATSRHGIKIPWLVVGAGGVDLHVICGVKKPRRYRRAELLVNIRPLEAAV